LAVAGSFMGGGSCELRLLLEAYLDYLRLECGLAENSLVAYRRDLELLLEFLFKRDIYEHAAVRADDLTDFLATQRNEGISARSIGRRVGAIRLFFRFAGVELKREADPALPLQPPKLSQPLPDYLTDEQVNALLEAPTGTAPLILR